MTADLHRIKCLSWGFLCLSRFHYLKPNCIRMHLVFVPPIERSWGGSVVAGGIGDYGSDESEDDDARSARGSDSSETDEEELHHRIRAKQDAFRRKEQELQEKLAQEALIARGESQVRLFLKALKRN